MLFHGSLRLEKVVQIDITVLKARQDVVEEA